MEIKNNIEEEEDVLPLPKARGKKDGTESMLPPPSKDKLISSTSRFNREKRQKELEERRKKKEEQIYNKQKEAEEEEKVKQEKKVQIEFMKPNGSFIFQTLMEFHQVYSFVYFIIEELLFVYKCYYFDFPRIYTAGLEITSLIFYLFVQLGRFYFGSLGNRAETSMFVLICFIFSLGAGYTYAHFLFAQTFVLRIELITNSIGLGLWGLESAFAMIAFLGISSKESGI